MSVYWSELTRLGLAATAVQPRVWLSAELGTGLVQLV